MEAILVAPPTRLTDRRYLYMVWVCLHYFCGVVSNGRTFQALRRISCVSALWLEASSTLFDCVSRSSPSFLNEHPETNAVFSNISLTSPHIASVRAFLSFKYTPGKRFTNMLAYIQHPCVLRDLTEHTGKKGSIFDA